MRLLSTLISRQLFKKLPRCLTPVCHDITLPSNITCSVSLTDSPYLIQIVFCALKVIKLLVAKSLQIFIILFKSLCQDWVHLECFIMAAGMDEALFQGTKVDPTKKKKVKRSVNEGRVITQDQLDLIEAALSAQCVIVICKRCQSGGDVKKIITKLYNTASKAAVLTEALEGRMKSVGE